MDDAVDVDRIDWRNPPALELTRIMEEALVLFNESGFHGTSVRDIATRVGVTVPALYYHHRNKEDVLFSMLERSIDYLGGLVDLALEEAGDDPRARFENLVLCIVGYMGGSVRLARLDAEIRSLSPEARSVYETKRLRVERALVETIEKGVNQGVMIASTPQLTARALLGMFQAITSWYRPDGPLAPEDLATVYLEIAGQAVALPQARDVAPVGAS